jgi:hypothetical protein
MSHPCGGSDSVEDIFAMKKSVTHSANFKQYAASFTRMLFISPLLLACGTAAQAASHNAVAHAASHNAATHAHTNEQNASLKPFVGTWYNHGGVLRIESNGDATYDARAYKWCGSGVSQPCDSFQGNLIIDGIHMQIHFSGTKDSQANGQIDSSTTGDNGRSVQLTLNHNHTANFAKSGSTTFNQVVCDLQAQPGTCGA